MDIRILNFTGVSLKIKWDSTHEIIGCSSEKVIQIEKSSARLTRFYAKYKSTPDSPLNTKGQINTIFTSGKQNHTLILGAFVDGEPKYIGCITANEVGRYLYNEFDRKDLTAKYPGVIFYNIPIDLYYTNNPLQKIKKIYRTVFNTAHCENRDGPMCDKFVGIPVLLFLGLVFFIILAVVIGTLVMGWIELHRNGYTSPPPV